MQKDRPPLSTSHKHDSPNHNHSYYTQYQKVYQMSVELGLQLQRQVQRTNLATQRIQQLAERAEQFRDSMRPGGPQRKRKSRRAADQIEKQHTCELCQGERSYASLASLRIHIKLKHPEHYSPRRGKSSQSGGSSPQE